MTYAYDKVYLDKAAAPWGVCWTLPVHDLGYDIGEFFDLFISTGTAERFETGDYTLLVGKSGVELAYEVLDRALGSVERISPRYTANRSEEYWTGWALAYYQWETALSFREIVRYVPIKEIRALYSPYHEMDIRQFVDKINDLYRAAKPDTNLKVLRQRAGLSQRELAERSGVPLRTIQQYEQRQKQINKAQAEYLAMLAKALRCDMEDLIERVER